MSRVALDLTGQTFGRLTVTKKVSGPQWACRCACGTEVVVKTLTLRNGGTKSCGCLRREQVANRKQKLSAGQMAILRAAVTKPHPHGWKAAIARMFGVSRQRIHQLVQQLSLETA